MKTSAKTRRRKFLVAEGPRLLGVVTLADLLTYLAVVQELGAGGNAPATGRESRSA